MPLIYASVSRGTTTVAEYAAFSGNFGSVAKEFLERAGKNEGKFTYTVDGHTFNFLTKAGYTYLAVADEAYGRAIPSEFLNRMHTEFVAKFADKGMAAKEHSLNSSFGKQLKSMLEHATQFPGEYSKVANVTQKVNEVKGVMVENLERMLQRGEKLELLTDKTETLMSEVSDTLERVQTFQKHARTVRRQLWCQNMTMKLVVAGSLLLLVVVIFLIICFAKYKCFG